MDSVVECAWSSEVAEADWISGRLAARSRATIVSVVPSGYEAYARVLHPARVLLEDGAERPARWAEVASWSGTTLEPSSRFHSVALPPGTPASAQLAAVRPPRRGGLGPAETSALAGFLAGRTSTPQSCWFCLWEGYAWRVRADETIPAHVLGGPKVALSGREYVLYAGPAEAAAPGLADLQTANLWWPRDRSWFVASDIDLPWTYVGADAETIAALVDREDLEALPCSAGEPLRRVERWVHEWASSATGDLMSTGHCLVSTSRGTVEAWLERPGLEPGALGITSETDDGRKWSRRTRLDHRVQQDLRRLVELHLAMAVVDLAEG